MLRKTESTLLYGGTVSTLFQYRVIERQSEHCCNIEIETQSVHCCNRETASTLLQCGESQYTIAEGVSTLLQYRETVATRESISTIWKRSEYNVAM